nr:hypothetical protein [Tanacetum cinerariifolium]
APAKVHNAKDTLEIGEITRKKMNAKMTDPECVTHKKQLTPEQIYWSNDLMKLKSEALKERTKVSRPIKAFTVYPPNTPATLVPKVLPTTSQVKIHIFTLIQMFSEFDKTCKKRITPTVFTDGEQGFEQTKACYLQKVFSVATKSELNVARFAKMHVANTFVEARCLALEAELTTLRDKSHQENQGELIKHFSKLETTDSQITKLTDHVTQLQAQNDRFRAENDKIKQHYKELHDTIKITCAKHIEQVTKLTTKNLNLKTCVSKATVNPQVSARYKHAIDVELIVPRLKNNKDAHIDYLRHVKESVETIRDIVEEAKVVRPLDRSIVSACRYTKHYQELLEYAIGTCPQGSQQRAKQLTYTPLIRKKKVTTTKPFKGRTGWKPKHVDLEMKQVWKPKQVGKVWKPTGKVLTTIGHKWRPTGQILHLGKQCPLTRFTPPQVVVQIVIWYLDSGCSKHMTGDRSRLLNFMKKLIGTVRFGNDHFGAIMGYRDCVVGESVNSRVYYVKGLGHNLFSVGQFCDSDLEVAFRKHSCYARDTDGVDLIKCSRGSNLYTILVEDIMKTINDRARKDLVRRLPRLKFEKDHLCSACQLGKSKKDTHKPKAEITNLEVLNTLHMDLCGQMRVQIINGKKYILVIVDDYFRFTWVKFLRSKDETLDFVIKFITQIQVGLNKTIQYVRTDNETEFINHTMTEYYERLGIFYQKTVPRTPQQNGVVESEDLGKLQPTADTGIFVGYAPSRKGYQIYKKRTRRIMETIHVQFDELTEPMAPMHLSTGTTPNFLTPRQISSSLPMFDEYLEPPRAERSGSPAQAVQAPVTSAGTPLSTTIDQDAPSPHISSSSSALKSHSLPPSVVAKPHFMEDHNVAPVDNNPFVNVFAPKPHSEVSSSEDISSTESPYVS